MDVTVKAPNVPANWKAVITGNYADVKNIVVKANYGLNANQYNMHVRSAISERGKKLRLTTKWNKAST